MKKLLLALVLMLTLPLAAGIQNGQEIPDAITLTNSSNDIITVAGSQLYPGDYDTFSTNNSGSLVIKQGNKKYTISYPRYTNNGPIAQSYNTSCLDFATIAWLASNGAQYKNGIDQIEIENDTLYTIAVRYYLTKVRALPVIAQKISPQTSNSKIVRDETGMHPQGTVEITDGHNNKYSIKIPRRLCTRDASNNNWTSVTLCANTIALFNKGFTITIN